MSASSAKTMTKIPEPVPAATQDSKCKEPNVSITNPEMTLSMIINEILLIYHL